MVYIAMKIPVIESEKGWGRKIDDYMVCIDSKDCLVYKQDFNAKNTEKIVPNWYMIVEGEPESIFLTEQQYLYLVEEKRVWLSQLNRK
jgi:hypothetical protein